jgi:hypothetical protein
MVGFIHPDPIPKDYLQQQFCFQVLHPRYVTLDYKALMSSKDFLRRWSQSEWPTDDFSLEENLEDLSWHYEEQVDKIAFTYTVLDHNQTNCLGCIYIKPTTSIKDLLPNELTLLAPFSHFCSFWVIDTIRGTQLEQIIFSGLINWLYTEWQFPGLFFTSNPLIPEMESLYQKNGLQLFLDLGRPNRYQHCWKLKQGTSNGL